MTSMKTISREKKCNHDVGIEPLYAHHSACGGGSGGGGGALQAGPMKHPLTFGPEDVAFDLHV